MQPFSTCIPAEATKRKNKKRFILPSKRIVILLQIIFNISFAGNIPLAINIVTVQVSSRLIRDLFDLKPGLSSQLRARIYKDSYGMIARGEILGNEILYKQIKFFSHAKPLRRKVFFIKFFESSLRLCGFAWNLFFLVCLRFISLARLLPKIKKKAIEIHPSLQDFALSCHLLES